MVVLISEFRTGFHHVIHCNGKFTGNGISSFFLFAGLLLKVVPPYPEHFVMPLDETVCTHVKCFMQGFVTASFGSAGHLTRTDLKTWVETAISR